MSEQIEKNNNEKREIPVVTPKVDIMETETIVYLVAEMPGVSEKNVDIDLQGNNLTIRGSTVPDSGQAEPTRSEYYPEKAYERQFTLGNSIDLANISANMKDGILRLTLPKVKEHSPRKIEVKCC
ncbi:MAG: Hsp20/alpha crystallin family protein [Victivallales bacterium]|nr:Hsp20/alpha crystallin family protein [Victivallales bacterium]